VDTNELLRREDKFVQVYRVRHVESDKQWERKDINVLQNLDVDFNKMIRRCKSLALPQTVDL